MPKSPFPDPACGLPDEYGLLAAVLASPHDDLPKLVYADFLEEHADPRGSFLRKWVAAKQAKQPRPKAVKGVSQCWLSVIGYTLDAALERLGNPAWADAVRQTAEPGVLVNTKPHKGKQIPVGASKMGGLPDLDPDTEWPDGVDGPAAFVAQWNLAELAISPVCRLLPRTGLLSFFIDLVPFVQDSGDGDTTVIYTPDVSELETRVTAEAMDEANELRECRVEFREWMTLPDTSSPILRQLRVPDDALDEYLHYYYGWSRPDFRRQIHGFPKPVQSDPTPHNHTEWRLLTQFMSDGDAGLEACDGGAWYFMIRERDLKKANFDDVSMEFQTG